MSDESQKIINDTFELLIKTYAPQPVVMDRGEGCKAWDTDGKEYLDFAAGIAVASLGHAHPAMLDTINKQSARLMACQASYATKEKLDAAKLLIEHSCFDLVYFSNSGTEGIETAIKMVRKWAYDNKGHACNEIVAFHNSFHGRSMGSASLTEKCHSQPYFGPYLPGIHFATFNDIESVKALISDKTAAIFIEPVQGEGGLAVAEQHFMDDLRTLCDKEKIALVFDEIQCGMGRLGTFFAYENWGVEPDIACLAKGLGSGFPVGAVVAKNEFGSVLENGTHGTTYGGNPLACAVAATVMKELLKPGFLESVRKNAALFTEGLKEIQRKSNKITQVKGMGLMVGIETTLEIKKLISALQKNGMMTTQAGKATLRMTPPLIAGEAEIRKALSLIEKTLQEGGEE